MSTASTHSPHKPLVIAVALALGLGLGSAHAASITVTDGGDAGAAGTCTLRQAIESANTDTAVGTCAAGAGTDTVSFSGALANSTITLGGTQLEVTDDLIITGSGQTIDANGASRVLYLDSYTSLTASNLTITGGITSKYSGGNGAGIRAGRNATLTLSACTITGNAVSGDGGGIYAGYESNLTLAGCTITGNAATGSAGDGGGIALGEYAALTLTDSTISGNSADDTGGALYTVYDNTVSIINSTISGNDSGFGGGGIYAWRGDLSLTNSTISGNEAAYQGGGIYALGGTLNVNHSTITGNQAGTTGGGIYVSEYDAVVTLQNTLLSGNSAPDGIDLGMGTGGGGPQTRKGTTHDRAKSVTGGPPIPTTVTVAASLLGTSLSGIYPGNGNVFSDIPGLGALANNGGPTLTMLPQPGSPVLDAGNNSLIPSGVTFDQRGAGFPRIMGARVDIGAVEAAAAAAPPPTMVPAGSTWTLSLLGLLLGTLGFFGLRGRQPNA